MVLYTNIWQSFEAIYAIAYASDLVVVWPENAKGEPGDWCDPEHVRNFECF